MDDDGLIVEAAREGLDDALRVLGQRGRFDGRVIVSADPRWATTTIDLTGRFAAAPDREVSGVVTVDPARVGWRIEASLWTQRDDEPMQALEADLGSSRVIDVEAAVASARTFGRGLQDAMVRLDPTR